MTYGTIISLNMGVAIIKSEAGQSLVLKKNITINAPVFLMEREVMDFWREICITRPSYRGGPKKV